jgi:hypothetical protein
MTSVRSAVVAGTFYPRDPAKLEATVRALLDAGDPGAPGSDRPYAAVVPHAGYRFSGPVAASVYARGSSWGGPIRRIALFGPSHFAPIQGSVACDTAAWETPLGALEIDEELREVARAAGVSVSAAPHEHEHSLEVQLPWIQLVFGRELRILPVAVGVCTPAEAAAVIAAVGDVADLVIISTDLSHHLPQEQARSRDRSTADAVLARDAEAIGSEDACGVYALRGIAELAYQRSASVELLDLRTSGDTAGDVRSVVGYGAFTVGRR